MLVLERDPSIGIDIVPDNLGVLERWEIAKLFSNLSIDSQDHYRGLGETRVDEDPAPGTMGDLQWRVDDFENMTKLHIVSFALSEVSSSADLLQAIDPRADALKGMVKVSRLEGVTEIEECNVRSTHRGIKLARSMLWLAAHFIPEQDELIAEVHERNENAKEMWEHYNFVRDYDAPPKEHRIFTGAHLLYRTTGQEFREALDLSPSNTFV